MSEPKTRRVKVKDLKPGDRVTLEGKEFPVHRVTQALIFEGDVWEVFVSDNVGGHPSAGLYQGNDITEVSTEEAKTDD